MTGLNGNGAKVIVGVIALLALMSTLFVKMIEHVEETLLIRIDLLSTEVKEINEWQMIFDPDAIEKHAKTEVLIETLWFKAFGYTIHIGKD